ncbi:DNA polymerase III subunit gamma and tau [Kribbella sp. NPDC056861]|uniref:DNA polymerase III subunit gamma and tau n=1 Tax=Kribbella sp. NPDC056861 TaxID=3154857 RepID=UPI00342C1B30
MVGEELSGLGARVAVVEAPLALYRRYRPETFSEVIGQDHVTVPLRNALSNNRVNHAYLFSGPRGCGKTTSARILARAINCEQGPIAEPCGVCKSCTDLARGGPGSIDVIEIDAASHGGVDDARDLRERAFFAPVESRYKIYIIDEAHMVTTQGFNALLKLVEEPPPHLKFIFATTEPEKVIGTIRSRTHHYPFRLVPPKALSNYMATLCEAEGVTIEPAALPLVVRAGAGSVRDSLSVLDQLIGGADAEGVTYRLAVQLLGFTPDSLLDGCVDGFAAHDSRAVFETIEKVIETGQDPKRFAEDLLRRLRDLVILSAVPNAVASGLIEAAEDQGERLQTQAAGIGPAELTRAADIVAAGLLEMRGATAPRLQLELICAKVLLPGADDSTNGIQARLDRMERRLTITGGTTGGTTAAPAAALPVPDAQVTQQQYAAPQQPPAAGGSQHQAGAVAANQATPLAGVSAQGAGDTQAGSSAHAEGAAQAGGPGHAQGASSAQTAGAASAQSAGQSSAAASAQDPASAQGGPQSGAAQSAPPSGAAQSVPAVDNSGARSGAWGAEPTSSAGQGSQAAASVTPPVASGSSQAAPAQAAPTQPPAQAAPAQATPPPPPRGAGGPAVAGTSSGSVGLIDVRRLWPEILEAVKAKRRFAWIMLSQNAQVIAIDEQTLTLGLVNAGARESFARSGSDEILREAMIATIGLNRRIEAVVDPSSDPGAVAPAASVSAPPAPQGPPPSSSWDSPSASSGGPAEYGGASSSGHSAGSPGDYSGGGSNASAGTANGSGAGTANASAGAGGSGVATAVLAPGEQQVSRPGDVGQQGGQAGGSAGDAAGAAGGSGAHGGQSGGLAGGTGGAGGFDGAGGSGAQGGQSGVPSGGAGATGGPGAQGGQPGVPAGGAGSAAGGAGGAGGAGAAGGQGAASGQGAAGGQGVQAGVAAGGVQVAPVVNDQSGMQSDQQAGGPPAPSASPAPPVEDRREQAASKRRAAEAAVAAEQSLRASQVQVQEAPLTPEEEAEAIGDDDVILAEDSRSHTDLLAETLGAQIISEEPN